MSWNAVKQGAVEQAKRDEAKKHQRHDFWLKPGEEKEILIVDSEPTPTQMHKIKHGQNWQDTKTYVCQGANCKHCASGDQSFTQYNMTIIDTKGYFHEGEQKWKGKYESKNLPMYIRSASAMQATAAQAGDNLKGCLVIAKRSGDKAARCGDSFTLRLKDGKIMRYDLQAYKIAVEKKMREALKDPTWVCDVTPIDYAKAFPKDSEAVSSRGGSEAIDLDEEMPTTEPEDGAGVAESKAATAPTEEKVDEDVPF